jgi:hypothetical protein
MSAIKFSEQHYAAIKSAADADGMPVDAWVVAHLPLDRELPQPAPEVKPARTMADLFAGRVGVVASGGDGRLSENTGEKFADMLVEQRRAGRL